MTEGMNELGSCKHFPQSVATAKRETAREEAGRAGAVESFVAASSDRGQLCKWRGLAIGSMDCEFGQRQ